jgi:hypothetical protein
MGQGVGVCTSGDAGRELVPLGQKGVTDGDQLL